MTDRRDDSSNPTMALAALAVAFARTLNEEDPTFVQRLKVQLETLYRELEDRPGVDMAAYEVLASTNHLFGDDE